MADDQCVYSLQHSQNSTAIPFPNEGVQRKNWFWHMKACWSGTCCPLSTWIFLKVPFCGFAVLPAWSLLKKQSQVFHSWLSKHDALKRPKNRARAALQVKFFLGNLLATALHQEVISCTLCGLSLCRPCTVWSRLCRCLPFRSSMP